MEMIKTKIITDQEFLEYFNANKAKNLNVQIEDVAKLKNHKEIVKAISGINLLFIVTDEVGAWKVSRVADLQKLDLILVIIREKFERHARSYIFPKAHSMTAIPYSENQNEICCEIIEKITAESSLGENEFFAIQQFFDGSYYFEYSFGKVNLNREKFFNEGLKIGNMEFSTFRWTLYKRLNLKVISTGKKHLTGKMDELIAYDDIDDLKTDSDIKLVMQGCLEFLFLILEPDTQNWKKYKKVVEIARKYRWAYPRIITISMPQEEGLKSLNADINITTNNKQVFYENLIHRFDRRRKFADDEIGTMLDFRNVRAEYFEFSPDDDNEELKNFLRNIKAKAMFMDIKYGDRESDTESLTERKKILNLIEEVSPEAEQNILWYGFGGGVLGKKDKNLVSFYVKD